MTTGTPDNERLAKLEESLMFAEHTSEQLSEEVRELNRMIVSLTARVARLEARLESVLNPPEEGDGDDA